MLKLMEGRVTQWRFGETEADGQLWLQRSASIPIYVEYESVQGNGSREWRRVLVATKAWLEEQLAGIGYDGARPKWAALPLMLVVPDAASADLRRVIDIVVQQGGFDAYSSLIE